MEKELIEYIAKAIVSEPDAVQVESLERDDSILFKLRVAEADTGRVIGKAGRIAKAIRTVLNAAAVNGEKHCLLKIVN